MPQQPTLDAVTARIRSRSQPTRSAYLHEVSAARITETARRQVHSIAANSDDRPPLHAARWPELAIVPACNECWSGDAPLGPYTAIIEDAARKAEAIAHFVDGVPDTCDDVSRRRAATQPSRWSGDALARSFATALSQKRFDGRLYLGFCGGIVPGLLIGALQSGHLPAVFAPAGPLYTGLSNSEKSATRQLHTDGKLDHDIQPVAIHRGSACNATADISPMLMEIMGLHLPGARLAAPDSPLRDALTRAAVMRLTDITLGTDAYTPIAAVIDERAIVNGIVGLLATGGSNEIANQLVAIARAAGILIDGSDFDTLSPLVPLLAPIDSDGGADAHQLHATGGTGELIRVLLDAGLLHGDVTTVAGRGLARYTREPFLYEGGLMWLPGPATSTEPLALRQSSLPFGTHVRTRS